MLDDEVLVDLLGREPLGGNTGRAQVQGLSLSANGDVENSGAFRGTGDFNPDPALETWLSSSGEKQTVFTATMTQSEPDLGAPTVDAGDSQTILITGTANLHGTVADDGLPYPVTTTWSLHSGPGTVAASRSARRSSPRRSWLGCWGWW